MANIPYFVSALFLFATLAAIFFFYKAAGAKSVLIILVVWAMIQSLLALSGFYEQWDAIPPRILVMVPPAIATIIFLMVSARGRKFVDSLDGRWLLLLHTVRIPVEIVLYNVLLAGLIPRSMTFEGTNLDIFSGITAPIIYYLYFVRKRIGRTVLLLWNFVCLALLLNVVITALLSARTPLQQFAFEQPNTMIAYFPFVLLPALVVPLVLLSHLVVIRRIVTGKRAEQTALQ